MAYCSKGHYIPNAWTNCFDCTAMTVSREFDRRELPGEMVPQFFIKPAPKPTCISCQTTQVTLGGMLCWGCTASQAAPPVEPFGDPISKAEEEMLIILAEECGEVIKRVTKILRFGKRRNPWDGQDNVERLESEIGDLAAVTECLALLKTIDREKVVDHAVKKLKAFETEEDPKRPRLRWATELLKLSGLSKVIAKFSKPAPRFQVGQEVEARVPYEKPITYQKGRIVTEWDSHYDVRFWSGRTYRLAAEHIRAIPEQARR